MKRLTTDEFIAKAKAVHGDLYDYSKVDYHSMNEKVQFICRKHGVFEQTPSNHLKGHGCLQCTKIDNRRMTMEDFIARSTTVHGDRFDYSKVNLVNTKTEVEIICKVHGVFKQKPEKHFVGQGCPLCAPNHSDTLESFVAKARKVHGDLYDYSQAEYINSGTKICIIDPEYGEFWQTPNAHLNGEGHPMRKPEKCYVTKKAHNSFHTSKPENDVKQMLIDKFGEDDVLCQHSTEKYPFACDFYIKSLDLYIELNIFFTHGGHWFDSNNTNDLARLEKIKQKAAYRNLYSKMIKVWTKTDLKKKAIAIENNLNYLVFWKYDLLDFMNWYNSFDKTHTLKCF